MDLSWLGESQLLVVTARQSMISSGMYSRFVPRGLRLLRFCLMDPLLLGAIQLMAVTAPMSKVNSGVWSISRPHKSAFAAILADGSVVTWGDKGAGADSSAVQDQLRNVQQIQTTGTAFAANFSRWISGYKGQQNHWWWLLRGPSSAQKCAQDSGHRARICLRFCPMDQLLLGAIQLMAVTAPLSKVNSGVWSISRPHKAHFAAILSDGSVVTWGLPFWWWWQLESSSTLEECTTDSGHTWRFRCAFGQMAQL